MQAVQGFLPGGHRSTPVKYKHMLFGLFPPSLRLPTYNRRSARHASQQVFTFHNRFSSSGLGSAKRYRTLYEVSIIRQISPGWVIFLQPIGQASVVSLAFGLIGYICFWDVGIVLGTYRPMERLCQAKCSGTKSLWTKDIQCTKL